MGLVKEINKYGTFFHSIRTHEDTFMLDLKLPAYWEVKNLLESLNSGVQIKTNDSNENHQLITFYIERTEEGINTVEKTVQGIIKWNRENEEKRELLDAKMVELQKIFDSNQIHSLRSLVFDFETNTPESTKDTNLTLDE